MKIHKLNENVDNQYMFYYNCNNPTFGYDFQRFANELGAKKMYGRYKGKGAGTHFYVVPSEDVYNQLKQKSKDYMVDMQRLKPFNTEEYPDAKIEEAMLIGYDKDTIKNMIERVRRNLEDYKSLLTEFPEDCEYWREMISKCELEIAELESYDVEV